MYGALEKGGKRCLLQTSLRGIIFSWLQSHLSPDGQEAKSTLLLSLSVSSGVELLGRCFVIRSHRKFVVS